MSKIGIFGGSFNPIHNGHIYIAEKVKDKFKLDKVIFIPTGIAPHKNSSEFADKHHRYNMVAIAIQDLFDISDIEVKTNKVCYAIDTMAELNNIYFNDDLYYIIGADSLLTFMKWKEPLKLFKMLHIVVVSRDGANLETVAEEYRCKYGATIDICDIDEIDISSTDIRNKIKLNEDFSGLVPVKVEKYIKDNGLYTEVL